MRNVRAYNVKASSTNRQPRGRSCSRYPPNAWAYAVQQGGEDSDVAILTSRAGTDKRLHALRTGTMHRDKLRDEEGPGVHKRTTR